MNMKTKKKKSSKKATHETDRDQITDFCQIINVGPATKGDFDVLGIQTPQDLIDKDPVEMYTRLCEITKIRHDPCMLDVFMAAVDYMNGNPPKAWWKYTAERKKIYSAIYENCDLRK